MHGQSRSALTRPRLKIRAWLNHMLHSSRKLRDTYVTRKARLSLAMHSYLQASAIKRLGFRCSQHFTQSQSNMETSRMKSRDDIMAVMHVVYTGNDALPIQQDTELWGPRCANDMK